MSEGEPTQALDIEHELEQIARGLSEADAARVRTLIYLAGRQQAQAVLPDPMTPSEVAARVARIHRAVGNEVATKAFASYSKTRRTSVDRSVAKLKAEDFGIDVESLPKTLRAMNRRYPEIKPLKGGFPKGYPAYKGPIAQMDWVRKQCLRIEVERARDRTQAELLIATRTKPAKDTDVPTPERDLQREETPPASS